MIGTSGVPLVYGVDYYPEQWPESRWAEDVRLMREVGIQVVRLAEFAWGLFEKEEGKFDFAWLDRALDILSDAGIKSILCTPTPTPPPWLTQKYPHTLRVNELVMQMHPGSRRQMCANSEDYVRLAKRITTVMAERYGHDERVVAWQLDNEYGCHDTIRCLCSSCEGAFHTWLKTRYGTLDKVNEAWGTQFWSAVYTDWSQIPLPKPSPAGPNPGLQLDYYRFSSATWETFNTTFATLLRNSCSPKQLITHNLMIHYTHFDHFKIGKELDFVCWDNYHHTGAVPMTVAANHDVMWGIKEKPFWVIEQQVGQVNWSRYNPLFPESVLTLKVMQAIAHGADGMVYFRWRQARFGAEMYHSGLLDFAARKTRAYDEARELGAEWVHLARELDGTAPLHQVAILLDFDSLWALEIQPQTESLNFSGHGDRSSGPCLEPLLECDDRPLANRAPSNTATVYWMYFYEAMWRNHIQTAVISIDSINLDRYKVLFAPFLHLATTSQKDRLQRWVEKGGVLLIGPRAGFKTSTNALHEVPQPGPLSELCGGTVREFDTCEPGDESVDVKFTDENEMAHRVGVWCEIWEPSPDTEILATYTFSPRPLHDIYGDKSLLHTKPAILKRQHKDGYVVTCGTFGGWKLVDHMLKKGLFKGVSHEVTLAPTPSPLLANLEAVRRGPLLFLLNHNPTAMLVKNLDVRWEQILPVPSDLPPSKPNSGASSPQPPSTTTPTPSPSAPSVSYVRQYTYGVAGTWKKATLAPYGYLVLRLGAGAGSWTGGGVTVSSDSLSTLTLKQREHLQQGGMAQSA